MARKKKSVFKHLLSPNTDSVISNVAQELETLESVLGSVRVLQKELDKQSENIDDLEYQVRQLQDELHEKNDRIVEMEECCEYVDGVDAENECMSGHIEYLEDLLTKKKVKFESY